MYRYDLIQYLINKYRLKSYLEIGIQFGQTFNRIQCERKVGVDPKADPQENIFPLTSDEFFGQNSEVFDIIFIDGLHLYEQVVVDIVNSWNSLSINGFVVLHDCLPMCKEMCGRAAIISQWTGDVWKAVVWFNEYYPEIGCCVLDIDYGCGVIKKSKERQVSFRSEDLEIYSQLDFNWMQEHKQLLNIVKNISDVE